jgi:ATP-binding protein involved in chromosome partitioning
MFRKLGIPVGFPFLFLLSRRSLFSSQITGAVLNMSHFLCPGSTTPHYIFGPPDSFLTTCSRLNLDVLSQIPIEPAVSTQGDRGAPVTMLSTEGGEARKAFLQLGEEVWRRLQLPTSAAKTS